MPVEIKELHIKAIVAAKVRENTTPGLTTSDISRLKKEIIKEVTDKIKHILKQKSER